MDAEYNFTAQREGKIQNFQCVSSLVVLEQTLIQLFELTPPFSIKFKDEENNLRSISNQLELEFAVSKIPHLQLVLEKEDAQGPKIAEKSPKQNLQKRLDFVNKNLEDKNLDTENRQKLTRRKGKIESQIQGAKSSDRAPKQNAKARAEARLQAIDTSLANPNLTPKQRQNLNKKKARTEAANDPNRLRGPAGRLAKIDETLSDPTLPQKKVERLNQKREQVQSKLQLQKVREQKSDARRQAQLENIKETLAKPNLPAKRRQRLLQKEEKVQSFFLKQEVDLDNILSGLSL